MIHSCYKENSYVPFAQTLSQGNSSSKCYVHCQMVNKKPRILHTLTINLLSQDSSHCPSNNKQISTPIKHNLYFVIKQRATCFGFLVSHQTTQEYGNMHCCFYNKTQVVLDGHT